MCPTVPELTSEQLAAGLIAAAAVALLSLLLCALALARVRRVRRDYALLRGTGDDQDVVAHVNRVLQRLGEIERRLQEIERAVEDVALAGRHSLQRFGLVRFDAFEDMGGQLSFSAALLDDYGDGLVITSINGRTETRTYAKTVKNMRSAHNLSEEELEALSIAASGQGRQDEASVANEVR